MRTMQLDEVKQALEARDGDPEEILRAMLIAVQALQTREHSDATLQESEAVVLRLVPTMTQDIRDLLLQQLRGVI